MIYRSSGISYFGVKQELVVSLTASAGGELHAMPVS
jgi:hypothetical protein